VRDYYLWHFVEALSLTERETCGGNCYYRKIKSLSWGGGKTFDFGCLQHSSHFYASVSGTGSGFRRDIVVIKAVMKARTIPTRIGNLVPVLPVTWPSAAM